MSLQTWQETIANQKQAAGLLNTYTTAKSVIDPTALVTLPSNYLELGKRLRITALGGISNIVTAQPTFTFQIMMGSIVVHTSGAILTTTTAHTLIPFKYVVDLRVDSVGNGTLANFLVRACSRDHVRDQRRCRRSDVGRRQDHGAEYGTGSRNGL
jgi:hypothetical protein